MSRAPQHTPSEIFSKFPRTYLPHTRTHTSRRRSRHSALCRPRAERVPDRTAPPGPGSLRALRLRSQPALLKNPAPTGAGRGVSVGTSGPPLPGRGGRGVRGCHAQSQPEAAPRTPERGAGRGQPAEAAAQTHASSLPAQATARGLRGRPPKRAGRRVPAHAQHDSRGGRSSGGR